MGVPEYPVLLLEARQAAIQRSARAPGGVNGVQPRRSDQPRSTPAAATGTTRFPWALSEWWLDPRGPDQGDTAKYFKYDPAAAKQLLAAAGYPDGLKVDMISTPGYGQVWVQYVELMQQGLKAAGIDANIQMQEYTAYIASTFKGQFEGGNVLVLGLETPFTEPHDFLFNMYHPNGTRNHASVNDPKLTAMIEQQRKTLDRAERKKQIFDIQRYLAEQMYYPPQPAGMRSAGVQPYVKDLFPRSDYGFGAGAGAEAVAR